MICPHCGGDPYGVMPALHPRERLIARLLCDGMSHAEIAHHLVISRGTVKTHLANIRRKLGIRNNEHLVATLLLPLDSPLRKQW